MLAYTVIHTVFRVYYALIILRVLMSWIQVGNNPITRFIY
ncbi:MAG: YggT family protein, partial [Firmicutes bacterium]|nr:YggT family protein [Bacillota bacterium]